MLARCAFGFTVGVEWGSPPRCDDADTFLKGVEGLLVGQVRQPFVDVARRCEDTEAFGAVGEQDSLFHAEAFVSFLGECALGEFRHTHGVESGQGVPLSVVGDYTLHITQHNVNVSLVTTTIHNLIDVSQFVETYQASQTQI